VRILILANSQQRSSDQASQTLLEAAYLGKAPFNWREFRFGLCAVAGLFIMCQVVGIDTGVYFLYLGWIALGLVGGILWRRTLGGFLIAAVSGAILEIVFHLTNSPQAVPRIWLPAIGFLLAGIIGMYVGYRIRLRKAYRIHLKTNPLISERRYRLLHHTDEIRRTTTRNPRLLRSARVPDTSTES
jgi:hypothetical protein